MTWRMRIITEVICIKLLDIKIRIAERELAELDNEYYELKRRRAMKQDEIIELKLCKQKSEIQ